MSSCGRIDYPRYTILVSKKSVQKPQALLAITVLQSENYVLILHIVRLSYFGIEIKGSSTNRSKV